MSPQDVGPPPLQHGKSVSAADRMMMSRGLTESSFRAVGTTPVRGQQVHQVVRPTDFAGDCNADPAVEAITTSSLRFFSHLPGRS